MIKRKYRILASDSGFDRKLRFSSFLRMVEEISIADVIRGGLPKERTLEKGLLWVISRMSFRFKKIPQYDDEVALETYALPRMRLFFPRYYVMRDINGSKLAEGEAMWCLIDEKTRKPIVPSLFGISIHKVTLPPDVEVHLDSLFLPRIKTVTSTMERKVLSSELDLNGHLTNTRYADWYYDAHSREFWEKHEISSFRIAFEREVHSEDTIKITFDFSDPKEEIIEGHTKEGRAFVLVVGFRQ